MKFKRCRRCGVRHARWTDRICDEDLGNCEVHSPLIRKGYCRSCFEELRVSIEKDPFWTDIYAKVVP